MKLLIILAIAATSMAAPDQNREGSSPYATIEEGLRALMERVREAMGTGVPSMDLPIIDPYQKDSANIKMDIDNVIQLEASFEQLDVRGLQTFVVNAINFEVLRLRFGADLTVPLLRINGDHYKLFADVLGRRSFLEIFGEGVAELNITNLDIVIDAKLSAGIISGYLNMTEMKIDVKMGSVSANLQGLMGGGAASDAMNEILADLIPALVVYEGEVISEILGKRGAQFANKYLQKLTLADIINMITGSGSIVST